MVHETVVHRGDVTMTVDEPYEVDAELAADGISEWLALVTSPGAVAAVAARPDLAEELRGQGQTLHLHATDPPGLGETGQWVIQRGPDAVTWHHGGQSGDVTVRGLADDLLLALLGRFRSTDERIEILGDASLDARPPGADVVPGPEAIPFARPRANTDPGAPSPR